MADEHNVTRYVCIMCGGAHGEPAPNNEETWYWRVLPASRVGPFCTEACVRRLITDTSGFNLGQVQTMEFWRYLALTENRACAVPAGDIPAWMVALEEGRGCP